MSADNWTICPRCHEQYEKKCEDSNRALDAAYGKVTAEEYIRLMAENDKLQSEGESTTLREDYEQGVDESGEYSLTYSGQCTACGWSYRKEIDEKVYP